MKQESLMCRGNEGELFCLEQGGLHHSLSSSGPGSAPTGPGIGDRPCLKTTGTSNFYKSFRTLQVYAFSIPLENTSFHFINYS